MKETESEDLKSQKRSKAVSWTDYSDCRLTTRKERKRAALSRCNGHVAEQFLIRRRPGGTRIEIALLILTDGSSAALATFHFLPFFWGGCELISFFLHVFHSVAWKTRTAVFRRSWRRVSEHRIRAGLFLGLDRGQATTKGVGT